MSYEYTKNWFYNSSLYNSALSLLSKDKKYNILEIGCYEGLSSCFFSDNFLDFEGSTLDCVDPFLNDVNNDHKDLLNNEEELRFDRNISRSKNFNKVKIHKITSDEFFSKNDKIFNFIYIDGCHLNSCVEKDLANSFNFLENGGIIWMDDYGGGSDENNMRNMVDNFIAKNNCKIILKNYQIAFIKN